MLVGISVAAIVKLPSMPECIDLVMVLTRGKWFSLLLKIVKVVVDIALFQIIRFECTDKIGVSAVFDCSEIQGILTDTTYNAVVSPTVVARKLEQWFSKSIFTDSESMSTVRAHISSQKPWRSRRKRLPIAMGHLECPMRLGAPLETGVGVTSLECPIEPGTL
jgi:hypothetical protein